MLNISEIFRDKIEEIFASQELPERLAVAVSGGVDSVALAMLMKKICDEKKIELLAVTVDHKMREGSSVEALELSKMFKKEKISHAILEINSEKIPEKNIEARLRELRYELLRGFCEERGISHLFLGHQLGDVAENFLIRLFRGSGLDGLSTMAEVAEFKGIKLVRPLLEIEKDELKKYLNEKKIKWFEDETNADEKFLRNKIRNFFETFEDKNLIQKRIKNSTDEIAEMRDIFDSMMLREAAQMLEFKTEGFFLIDRKKLQETDEKIALKILALVAMEVSGKDYKPRLKDLKLFYEYLMRSDKIKRREFYGCVAEEYDVERLIVKPQKLVEEFYLRTVLKNLWG